MDAVLPSLKDDTPILNEAMSLKEVMPVLMSNMSSKKTVRLNIRRKYIWKDLKGACQQGIGRPEDHVKIVFMGEPAIDDGGPRRKFSSGMPTFLSVKLLLFTLRLSTAIIAKQ